MKLTRNQNRLWRLGLGGKFSLGAVSVLLSVLAGVAILLVSDGQSRAQNAERSADNTTYRVVGCRFQLDYPLKRFYYSFRFNPNDHSNPCEANKAGYIWADDIDGHPSWDGRCPVWGEVTKIKLLGDKEFAIPSVRLQASAQPQPNDYTCRVTNWHLQARPDWTFYYSFNVNTNAPDQPCPLGSLMNVDAKDVVSDDWDGQCPNYGPDITKIRVVQGSIYDVTESDKRDKQHQGK